MKKLMLRIILAIFLTTSIFGTQACSKVPAGHKGIKVYLLGTSKGVDQEELGVGRYFIGWNQELYLFPTFTQNYVWTKDPQEGSRNDESITFQSKEGMNVGADIGISYHIDPDKVSNVFQKYRRGVTEITDVFLRNMVRDGFTKVASEMEIDRIYGSGKTQLMDNVQQYVTTEVASIGIVIEKIYLINQLRLPNSVTTAINMKIEATQKAIKAENEVREAEAEAQKEIAKAEGFAKSTLIKAQAQAKSNKILAASLTPTLVQYKSVETWNGVLPVYSGNSVPIISLPKP